MVQTNFIWVDLNSAGKHKKSRRLDKNADLLYPLELITEPQKLRVGRIKVEYWTGQWSSPTVEPRKALHPV